MQVAYSIKNIHLQKHRSTHLTCSLFECISSQLRNIITFNSRFQILSSPCLVAYLFSGLDGGPISKLNYSTFQSLNTLAESASNLLPYLFLGAIKVICRSQQWNETNFLPILDTILKYIGVQYLLQICSWSMLQVWICYYIFIWHLILYQQVIDTC